MISEEKIEELVQKEIKEQVTNKLKHMKKFIQDEIKVAVGNEIKSKTWDINEEVRKKVYDEIIQKDNLKYLIDGVGVRVYSNIVDSIKSSDDYWE